MTSVENDIARLRRKAKRIGISAEGAGAAMAFTNMHFLFANVLNECQNGPDSPTYSEFLKYCGPDDSFVTFNWDTLLDRSLASTGCWEPRSGYGIRFDAVLSGRWMKQLREAEHTYRCGWRLLKLHGSTNWLTPHYGVNPTTLELQFVVPGYKRTFLYWASSFPFETHAGRWRGGYVPTCYGYYPPNAPETCFAASETAAPSGQVFVKVRMPLFDIYEPQNSDGIQTSPLLITPVRQKQYDGFSKSIELLWEQATKALVEADRIVIVGYSFPVTDRKIRTLLRQAVQASPQTKSIVIVDMAARAVASRLGASIIRAAQSVELVEATFEEYVDSLANGAAEQMALLAMRDERVGQWMSRLAALAVAGSK